MPTVFDSGSADILADQNNDVPVNIWDTSGNISINYVICFKRLLQKALSFHKRMFFKFFRNIISISQYSSSSYKPGYKISAI